MLVYYVLYSSTAFSFDVTVYKDLYRMEVFKVIREFRDDPRHAQGSNHMLRHSKELLQAVLTDPVYVV
jgi:hypothetical protein